MKISTKARYAIMSMIDLAKEGEDQPVSLGLISQRQNLPLPYLEQIFLKLRKNVLVKSVRGSNGGYILARSPSEIRIFDILISIENPMNALKCQSNSAIGCRGDGSRCSAHDLWEKLESVVGDFLKSVTLEDVCAKRIKLNTNVVNEMSENGI